MKQIDIIKTWSKQRCLVIDDIADVRASIKRWLVDFGCRDVDTAGNAEEAIDLCQHHRYDVILADYNLGAGKNGQQFLEEVRFHKLVSNTALFIMITAEADTHYVLHAIEYQPDDYLSKPLNRNSLRKRLDSALLKNEALRPIKKALDENNIPHAIDAADKTIERIDARYHNEIRRAQADLYCQNGDWDKALAIYNSGSSDNLPLWKQIGSARAKIGKKDFKDAEKILNQIIQQTPLCVEARDLQAELFNLRNDQLRRQEVLSQAVKISPRSSQRQRALGDASRATGDHGQAIQAWRSALRHSRNTCQEQADDYLHLANSLNELANESRGSKVAELTKEAMETLNKVEKKYPRNKVVQLRSKQLRAEVFDVQGNPEEYSRELQEAIDVHHALDYDALRTTSVQLCIDSARSFMNHGFYEEGEKLLEELAELTSDHELSVQIDKLRREPQTREGISYAAKLNKVGIEFYEMREMYQAQEAFEKVLNELPNHTGLNLNLIQVLVARQVKEQLDEKEKHLLVQCVRRVKHITPRSPHYKRFEYLREKCADLIEDESTTENSLTGAAG